MVNLSRNKIMTFAILKMETNEILKAGNIMFYIKKKSDLPDIYIHFLLKVSCFHVFRNHVSL